MSESRPFVPESLRFGKFWRLFLLSMIKNAYLCRCNNRLFNFIFQLYFHTTIIVNIDGLLRKARSERFGLFSYRLLPRSGKVLPDEKKQKSRRGKCFLARKSRNPAGESASWREKAEIPPGKVLPDEKKQKSRWGKCFLAKKCRNPAGNSASWRKKAKSCHRKVLLGEKTHFPAPRQFV